MRKEAMQMALDMLEESSSLFVAMLFEKRSEDEIEDQVMANRKAIEALRAALAQPEPEPEPVAWMSIDNGHLTFLKDTRYLPLYTAPPQRKEWVGLTDDDLDEIYNRKEWEVDVNYDYEYDIEAKLKEKNT